MVTARPDGPRDVGYRTISRPLLDALRHSGPAGDASTWSGPGPGRRCGTICGRRPSEHGSGWYQVVHFDLHGAFSDFAALEAGGERSGCCSPSGGLEPFEGERGFLFFETADDG